MRKFTLVATVLVFFALALMSFLIVRGVSGGTGQSEGTNHTDDTNHMDDYMKEPRPWDEPGAKQPEDYTWDEFLALSPELQIAFQNTFGSVAFEEWMNRVQSTAPEQNEYPWNQLGAKQPKDYTWAEFLELSSELQIAFGKAFSSDKDFEAWLNRVQPQEPEQTGYPWDQLNAKKPADYTWDEFLALSPELQIAFQKTFNSVDAFEAWMKRVQSSEAEKSKYPWEEPGAKQPNDYTWDEFLALPAELQIAFQNAFGSADEFEAWVNQASPAGSEQISFPWEQSGAKQPEDYTWDEFLDLSPSLQIAFQFAFDSAGGFEAWMNREMPKS